MAKTVTSVYLDETILGQARKRAALEERPMSWIVSSALSAYLALVDDDELETA